MKKILAMGLAAVIAAGGLALTTSTASASHLYRPFPFMYPYSSGAYFFFGTPGFGFSFGTPRHHSYRYAMNPHVAWCTSHYRTYNRWTNTYFIRRGVPAACISPFSY